MFPMKFFEYLAAGCPVVSTALPALEPFRDVAFLANTEAEFEGAVQAALAGKGPALSHRLSVARSHTYESRTTEMLEILEEPQ